MSDQVIQQPAAQPITPEVKPAKSKIEILAEIKKLFEKNNMIVDDEKIMEFFTELTVGEGLKKQFSIKLAKTKEQIIKVFPLGKVFVEKYNDYIDFTLSLFDEMINNFKNPKLFKPYMDENHTLGVKYAEIKELIKKDDGLYASIELNDLGIEAVKNNRYSYISPEWGSRIDTDNVKHDNVLWAITLTNIPALEGLNPTLQNQIKLNKRGESNMDLKTKIANLEGKLSRYKLADENIAALPPELMDAIAMLKEALAKIDELTGQAVAAQEQAVAATAQAATLQKEKSEKEKETFFNDAVSKGKIEIKELELMKSNYDKSPDFIKQLVNLRLEKTNGQQTKTTLNADNELTDEDYFIMDNQKLDRNNPDHIRQYKKIIGGK